MLRNLRHSLLLIALCFATAAHALSVDEPLADGAQEARAKALFQAIRCVVCQSEPIADSPAEVARDMRRTVREEIASGKSDDEIIALMVSRYGDFILMQPPLKNSTTLLWFGPLIVLGFAGLFVRSYFRKSRA